MKIVLVALMAAISLFGVSAQDCTCTGGPDTVETCLFNTNNNFLETCDCNGIVSVNWQNCNPDPNDTVAIFTCKDGQETYDYSPVTSLPVGDGVVEAGSVTFSKPPAAYTCVCLVVVFIRGDKSILLAGSEFSLPCGAEGTGAPVATMAPQTAAPVPVQTGVPVATMAPQTAAPVPVQTEAPVAPMAPQTAAPIAVGTGAPVDTMAPETAAPIPVESPAPIEGTGAPGTVVPVTLAPVSNTESLAPVAVPIIPPPSCSELGQDPYEFFGNGSFIPCCDANAQCLADWNNNTVWYYRCVDNCPSSPEIPPEPEIPVACTASGSDPYQVYGNGIAVPCCNPSKQCLNRWDGDDRNYYICVDETEVSCPKPPTSFCTARDDDPFQHFGTGEENECCTGLYKCLDNWDGDDRFYYRCESCCENDVDSKCDGIDPSPKSPGKKGARSSEINALVAVPGEYGVFTTQKSVLASGCAALVSSFGSALTGAAALFLL
jgi:hypothetical protein